MTDVMVIGDFGRVFRSCVLCGHPHACVACGADTAIGLYDRVAPELEGEIVRRNMRPRLRHRVKHFHPRRTCVARGAKELRSRIAT